MGYNELDATTEYTLLLVREERPEAFIYIDVKLEEVPQGVHSRLEDIEVRSGDVKLVLQGGLNRFQENDLVELYDGGVVIVKNKTKPAAVTERLGAVADTQAVDSAHDSDPAKKFRAES